MKYSLQHCFTDKWQYNKLPVAAYSPSLGCKLHAEPTVSNMSRPVSSITRREIKTIKILLTWLLELLVPPWGLIASFFTEPSPAFVESLLSPYENFPKNCDQYSVTSWWCKQHMSIDLFTTTTLVAQKLCLVARAVQQTIDSYPNQARPCAPFLKARSLVQC